MRKKQRNLFILLGLLVVICAAAVLVGSHEKKVEQIKNSGETILAIDTDTVTKLSWTNEEGTFSFTKADDTWNYDGDAAFPVDKEKIDDMLEQFKEFAAAYVIDDVEDYSQYGLKEPMCTIEMTAGEDSYTIELGDISKMDEQRYVSLGDGKAYLAMHDPYEEYDAVLKDMILDDKIPEFDQAEKITYTGSENYTIIYDEDGKSICADDKYFTTDGRPLDTDNVESWLNALKSAGLTEYVSYSVTDEELKEYGLDDPTLTVTMEYSVEEDKDSKNNKSSSTTADTGETDAATDALTAETANKNTFTIHISQNPEELEAYNKAVEEDEDELPEVTCYARVGDSQIVYKITESKYKTLADASYDTLRHQKLFTADFDTITSIDVSLEGKNYTFTYTPGEKEDDEGTWTYEDEAFEIADLKSAIRALSASDFTDEKPTSQNQEEISMTIHLDNEDLPSIAIALYRYDGATCLATVDGAPIAFVSRSQTVDLIEAVNALTLGR